MTTPFTPKAFTPPTQKTDSSTSRAILQLQAAVSGTGAFPPNNLNVLQNKAPPNNALSTIPVFRPGGGGGGGTGFTGATGFGATGPTGPVGFSAALRYTGGSGATFNFNITSTLGWPLCGFGKGANSPGNAWQFTPTTNGQMKVNVQGAYVAPTAQNMMVRIMWGTGTPPGYGGTGGSPASFGQNLIGAAAGVLQPLNLEAIVQGSPGVTYWFDIALLSNSPGIAKVGQLTPNSPIIWHVVEL